MNFLTPKQIQGLTNRYRRDKQREELNNLGIVYKVRGDGTLAVLEDHVAKEFDGYAESRQKKQEPNWDAL